MYQDYCSSSDNYSLTDQQGGVLFVFILEEYKSLYVFNRCTIKRNTKDSNFTAVVTKEQFRLKRLFALQCVQPSGGMPYAMKLAHRITQQLGGEPVILLGWTEILHSRV